MFHIQSIYHSPCFWTEQEMHYSWLKTKYMKLDNKKKLVVSVKLDSSQDIEEKHTNNNHHYVTAITG